MRGLTKLGRGPNLPQTPNDRIERTAQGSRTAWDSVLVWFMRVVALAWLAKGVYAWASILDVLPGARAFETEPFGRQTVTAYFAVMDPTAAIGLWLTSAWGGVVWLLAATSALTLAALTPQLLPLPLPVVAVLASIMAMYFIISWLAARDVR